MTSAPSNLLAVRNLLLTYLNVDKDTVRVVDLEPAEVGIVGDPAHRGGYHCGSDRVTSNDYSVHESSRDSKGLTSHASALDVGPFSHGSNNLHTFSTWCVSQCKANAPDTRDIREIIYSPDGKVVKRWDRLGRRTSGDSSHLYHTHFSFFRDSTKAGRDQTPLFRRYLTAIGLLEDDMANFTDAHAKVLDQLAVLLPNMAAQTAYTDGRMEAVANGRTTVRKDLKGGDGPVWIVTQLATLLSEQRALAAAVAQQTGNDVDEQAIVTGVLAGLTPDMIAAAIPPELARDVVDELLSRIDREPQPE